MPSNARLMLGFGQLDDQTVKLIRHLDLAGEARIRLCTVGETQHARLCVSDGVKSVEPCAVDMNVAGTAGTLAAAIAVDSGNAVVDRPLHRRNAVRQFDFMSRSILFGIDNSWH